MVLGPSINVTSFSSISYWGNIECWSQKQSQSGNIHSIILVIHVGRQSAQIAISSSIMVSPNFNQPGKLHWRSKIHIMENRLRHARGPVQQHWVHYINTTGVHFLDPLCVPKTFIKRFSKEPKCSLIGKHWCIVQMFHLILDQFISHITAHYTSPLQFHNLQ